MSDAGNDLADAQSRLADLASLGDAERVAALEAIAASLESALAREPD